MLSACRGSPACCRYDMTVLARSPARKNHSGVQPCPRPGLLRQAKSWPSPAHWRDVSAADLKLLIFDSTVTTHQLGELDARDPARPHPQADRATSIPCPPRNGPARHSQIRRQTGRVRVIGDPVAHLSTHPGALCQFAVADLGHGEPTILTSALTGAPTHPCSAKPTSHLRSALVGRPTPPLRIRII
jgi:hypothetical protein